MKNVAILLSGRGSNFMALADAIDSGDIPARIVAVVSNKGDAPGLQSARQRGYSSWHVSSDRGTRQEFEREVIERLKDAGAEVVCLAGFMRLLSPFFIRHFPKAILNIHPSLLPAFPGLHAQEQAVRWGAKISGCTVHFVDDELDHGPIILQQAVEVRDDDDGETLASRILQVEHDLYPRALRLVCENRVEIRGRRVLIR